MKNILIIIFAFYVNLNFSQVKPRKYKELTDNTIISEETHRYFCQKLNRRNHLTYAEIKSFRDSSGNSFINFSDSTFIEYYALGKISNKNTTNYLVLEKYMKLDVIEWTYNLFTLNNKTGNYDYSILGRFYNYQRAGQPYISSGMVFTNGDYFIYNGASCDFHYSFQEDTISVQIENEIQSIRDVIIEWNNNIIATATYNYLPSNKGFKFHNDLIFDLDYFYRDHNLLPLSTFYNHVELYKLVGQFLKTEISNYKISLISHVLSDDNTILIFLVEKQNQCLIDQNDIEKYVFSLTIKKELNNLYIQTIGKLISNKKYGIITYQKGIIKFDRKGNAVIESINL